MKNVIKFGSVLLAMGLLASCGEDKKETFTGLAGSCTYTDSTLNKPWCYNVTYNVEASEDPKEMYQSTQAIACSAQSQDASWSTTDACPTEAAVGSCKKVLDEGIEMEFVFSSEWSVDMARAACEDGTFTEN